MYRGLRISLFALFVVWTESFTPIVAQEIWTGFGGDNDWSTDANWQDGTAPVSGPTQHLIFQGSVGPVPTQDTFPLFDLNRITLGPGSGRILAGYTIQLSGVDPLIENTSTLLQRINTGVQLNAPLTEFRATSSGELRINPPLSEIGGSRGVEITAGVVTFGGVGYTGPTIVQGGFLNISNNTFSSPSRPVSLLSGGFGTFPGTQVSILNPVDIEGDAQWLNLRFQGPVTLHGLRTLDFNRSSSTGTSYAGRFDGDIGEAAPGAGIIKQGEGGLDIRGTTSFTGPVIVEAGSLQIGGQLGSATNPVDGVELQSGAILFAYGDGQLTNAADKWLVARSNSTLLDTLTATHFPVAGAGVDLQSDSIFNTVLGGETPGDGYPFHTQLDVTGAVKLGDGIDGPILDLEQVLGYVPPLGAEFMIIKNDLDDPVSGTFDSLPEGATLTQRLYTYQISYQGGDGNDIVLTAVVVPEPSTLLLLGLALIGIRQRPRSPRETPARLTAR